MRLRSMIAAGVLGLAFAVPAHAGEKPDPFAQVESLLAAGVLFQGVIREEDVSLVFAHLRAALMAAYAGREAPPQEELNRRAEAIAGELKTRGTLAGLLLLTALEAAAKQAMREGLENPAPAAR